MGPRGGPERRLATLHAQLRGGAATVSPSALGSDAPDSQAARRAAAWGRRRGVIVDDDGDIVYDPLVLSAAPADAAGALTSLRLADCVAAGVASVSWTLMWGIAIKPSDGVVAPRYWEVQQRGAEFRPGLSDPTVAVAEFCSENGIEVFGVRRFHPLPVACT